MGSSFHASCPGLQFLPARFTFVTLAWAIQPAGRTVAPSATRGRKLQGDVVAKVRVAGIKRCRQSQVKSLASLYLYRLNGDFGVLGLSVERQCQHQEYRQRVSHVERRRASIGRSPHAHMVRGDSTLVRTGSALFGLSQRFDGLTDEFFVASELFDR